MTDSDFLFHNIDFILWRYWDPIGGGTLGVPRDEYRAYVPDLVRAKLDDRSSQAMAALLDRALAERMGLEPIPGLSLETAQRIHALPSSGDLCETSLDHYLSLQEGALVELFEDHGYPTGYYFFEMKDMEDNFRQISEEKIYPQENYAGRWETLMQSGQPWINLAPRGYWGQAFVFCVEYRPQDRDQVPVRMTRVSLPGLPGGQDGTERIDFTENVQVI
jgi:hypothetical protein